MPAAFVRSCPGERPRVRQVRSMSGVLVGERQADPFPAVADSRIGRRRPLQTLRFGTGPAVQASLSRSGDSPVAGVQSRVERENLEPCAWFRAVIGCARRCRRLGQVRHLPRSASGLARRRRPIGSVPCRSVKVCCGRGEFRHTRHRGPRRNMKVTSGLKSFRGAYLVNIFLTRVPVKRESAFQPIENTRLFPLSLLGIPW